MLSTLFVASLLLLKVLAYRKDYTYGEEAEKLCKAYKKVCPIGKICVVQKLVWPRKMSFPVCEHERKIPAKSKICELPPSPGGCGARYNRWYFNVHTKECSPLTYSGCEGNLNNFHTKEKCEEKCEVGFTENIMPPEIIRVGVTSETPTVMAAPAPLRLQTDDIREALELAEEKELRAQRKLRRKHRRLQRKNSNGKRRRRKNRRNRKYRRYGSTTGQLAELRGRKTSYIRAPQSDEGPSRSFLRKMRRKQRRLANARRYTGYDGYYDKIRLFTLLGGNHRSPTQA